MTISKEQKLARIMMHVCMIIGAFCILFFIISIALQVWVVTAVMGILGYLQYYSYKKWQKKA